MYRAKNSGNATRNRAGARGGLDMRGFPYPAAVSSGLCHELPVRWAMFNIERMCVVRRPRLRYTALQPDPKKGGAVSAPLIGGASGLRALLLMGLIAFMTGCAAVRPSPPPNQDNLCEIFRENPRWYDYARDSERKWGTSVAIQMAFIQQESSFRSHVRPERTRLLGIIPWRRPSSAYGYAQAQDPVWGEYRADAGSMTARRTHMKHATDFIGWYNLRTHRMTGVSLTNAEHLYLAYHEGQGGYNRGTWRSKPGVQRAARQVAERAARYQQQLDRCESEFRCRRFYQVGPFCR